MSTKICRARKPEKCRVHGNSNPINVILNPVLASNNLNSSKKACDLASNLEELSEAKQLLAHDQKVYDATSNGRRELVNAMYRPKSFSDEIELKRRLDESVKYRKEIVENNAALKPSYEAFDTLVSTAGEESYVLDGSKTAYDKAYQELKKLPYGTPVAIKTLSGSILYDGAGDGLIPEANRNNFFNKIVKSGFVIAHDSRTKEASVGLKNSSMSFSISEIAEIHVLKENTFSSGIPEHLKTVGKEINSPDTMENPSVWSIEGNEFYYQLQGSLKSDIWQEGQTSMTLNPYKATSIKHINL